jgi:hypothetical protein
MLKIEISRRFREYHDYAKSPKTLNLSRFASNRLQKSFFNKFYYMDRSRFSVLVLISFELN